VSANGRGGDGPGRPARQGRDSARIKPSVVSTNGLPYVDEHTITIAAPRERAWTALQRYASASLRVSDRNPLAKLLGTQPRAGFEVVQAEPGRGLTLEGRHRFSRYRLAFTLSDGPAGTTQLRAATYAAFPGVRGQVYRALVIGSRGHRVAVWLMLRSVRRVAVSGARGEAGAGSRR
jgi:hypothetical protein